jgi:hypothetical protein
MEWLFVVFLGVGLTVLGAQWAMAALGLID